MTTAVITGKHHRDTTDNDAVRVDIARIRSTVEKALRATNTRVTGGGQYLAPPFSADVSVQVGLRHYTVVIAASPSYDDGEPQPGSDTVSQDLTVVPDE